MLQDMIYLFHLGDLKLLKTNISSFCNKSKFSFPHNRAHKPPHSSVVKEEVQRGLDCTSYESLLNTSLSFFPCSLVDFGNVCNPWK